MNTQEVLDDLNERIDRGVGYLDRLQLQARDSFDAARERDDEERIIYWLSEVHRLAGKAEGIKVVRDWLRSYAGTVDDGNWDDPTLGSVGDTPVEESYTEAKDRIHGMFVRAQDRLKVVGIERVLSAFGPALVYTHEDGSVLKVFDPS